MSKVEYIASAGLSTIINSKSKVFKKGGNLRIVGIQGKAREVFELAGLLDIFEIFDNQQRAFKNF